MDSGYSLLEQLLAFSKSSICAGAQREHEDLGRKSGNEPWAEAGQQLRVVKSIAESRARGETFSAIAASLNKQGLRGRNGARWYSASVREYLKRHSVMIAGAGDIQTIFI